MSNGRALSNPRYGLLLATSTEGQDILFEMDADVALELIWGF